LATFNLPGVVTFLFTDIEGSTRLWEEEPERMSPALAGHDTLVRAAVESNRGVVVKMVGDGVNAAFEDPLDAVGATLQLQQALADPGATNGVAIRVRCGLHMGVVERRDNDYFGSPVNRAARIMSAAHGGQVLLSQAVVDRVRERLPSASSLRDLGSVRLKDLSRPERVYQLLHPQLRQEFPALRSLEATPNNLPQQVSSFIGRERELVEVKGLLAQSRLLTLVGIGGIGKTRLALQAAAEVIEAYRDGVWLVELGSIGDASLVPTSVAQVLGVQERTDTRLTDSLCAHLKSRQLLLILDNCEHLLDACATLADAVLRGAAEPTIIATSREPLHVAGEQTYPLQTLSLAEPSGSAEAIARSEAVQLFVERARRQLPDFELTAARASAVAELCVHLDGIPLALELAAARIPSLSIEQISARLDDRFRLLTTGTHTALPRQQTLRATFDWSFDLLTEQERAVFRRLAIFSGGFTLEAASSIASGQEIDEFAVIDLVSQLVARSLVVADTSDARPRYRLLETTRTYAVEKLVEAEEIAAIRRRHAQYFRDRFEHAYDDWLRMPDADWRDIYHPELDNVRVALELAFGADGDPAIGIALAGASGVMWTTHALFGEGLQRLMAAVARLRSHTPALDQARLWLWFGVLLGLGAPARAVPALERAIDLYRPLDNPSGLGHSLVRLGRMLALMGQYDQSARLLAEALPEVERSGRPRALGLYFSELGFLKMRTGDLPACRMHYEKAFTLFRDTGAESSALGILTNIGDVTWALGDVDAALAAFVETVARMRKSPLVRKDIFGNTLINLAGVRTERGELDQALAAAREGLPLLHEAGYAWNMLDHSALRAGLAGKLANAARLAGYADSAFTANESSRQPNEARAHERLQALLRDKLDPGELTRLVAEGAKMSEDEACRMALEE
jgi:predicted ATPase/class 3 adenylate cyclase